MKKAGFLVSIVTALVATGIGARSASARPCCSACDVDNPPKACFTVGCTPGCVVEDEPTAPDSVIVQDNVVSQDSVVYDDVAKACYAANEL
jgi:hypothetical protein